MTELDRLHETFRRYLYLPDPAAVDFVAAVVAANLLPGDPVWGLVVGPSGGGKTEAVTASAGLEGVHQMSTLTEHTFLSGLTKGGAAESRRHSLLYRLQDGGKRIMVLKDFTSVLSMRREARGVILGQLREIYDGRCTAEFGNGRTLEWEGKLGLLAGVTPAIDLHRDSMAQLGERFLYLRLAEPADSDALTRAALAQLGHEDAMRRDLRAAFTDVVAALDPERAHLGAEEIDRVVRLSRLVALARSPIARDEYRHEQQAVAAPEAPTRVAKQLAQMWRALAALRHEAPGRAVARVAFDSMPPERRRILGTLMRSPNRMRTGELADAIGLETRTTLRRCDDLRILGLLDRDHPAENGPYMWGLSPLGREVLSHGVGGASPRGGEAQPSGTGPRDGGVPPAESRATAAYPVRVKVTEEEREEINTQGGYAAVTRAGSRRELLRWAAEEAEAE